MSRQRIRIPQGRPIDLVIEMDDGSVQVLEAARVVSVDKRSTCPDVRLEGQRWTEEKPAKGQEPKPQEASPKAQRVKAKDTTVNGDPWQEPWYKSPSSKGPYAKVNPDPYHFRVEYMSEPYTFRTADERVRDTREWSRQWSNRPTPEQSKATAESFAKTFNEVYERMMEAQRIEEERWYRQWTEAKRQAERPKRPKPPPTQVTTGWRTQLGYQETERPTLAEAQKRHRSLMAKAHPDAGGTHDQAVELNRAMDAARRELGLKVRPF
jgi:hypothetical protein